jgi:hypothetical protein
MSSIQEQAISPSLPFSDVAQERHFSVAKKNERARGKKKKLALG